MTRFSLFALTPLLASSLLISACSIFEGEPEKPPLPGERISILDLQQELTPRALGDNETLNITIPAAQNNKDWPQVGGYPHHAMQNLSVGSGDTLERIWQADIGHGGSDKIPLNAKPIVADGKVFTLDTRSSVRAFHNQTGKSLWEQDIRSLTEEENVISGGLAYGGGTLYATSGYDEVLALDPNSGKILWRTKIKAGTHAAPTAHNGRVFVTTLNNHMITLDSTNGKILWEHEGIDETTGLLGAASPAADGEIVIPAFSTGDIIALRTGNGSVIWEDSLANALRLGGMAGLSDIRGLPVIADNRVIAVSYGNKIAAFDKNMGTRLWQQDIGSAETPWVAGNVVYLLTSDAKVVALDITNGDVIWVSSLAKYEDEKNNKGLIHWAGPIMVNGKLLISGAKGRMVELAAETGQEIHRWSVRGHVSLAPIVADGALYVLTDDGKLSAYR